MKKLLLCIASLLIALSPASAQLLELSDSAKVYLETCTPGGEIYSAFGHSAIRIKDAPNDFDLTFNYGMFDFDTDGFYAKFISGQTDYELGIDVTDHFLRSYRHHGRGVIEQELNLTAKEKKDLLTRLMINYQPENRSYRYNYVYCNCATKPRNLIEQVVNENGGKINYVTDNGKQAYETTLPEITYRSLIAKYVGTDSWSMFGIDLLIGEESDRNVVWPNRMFLPDQMCEAFKSVERTPGQKLVLSTNMIISPTLQSEEAPVSPLMATSVILALVTLVTILRKGKMMVFDIFVYVLFGLLGCLIFYLSFFSLHPLVKCNYNLLWLSPLLLLLPLMMPFKKLRSVRIVVLSLCAITTIIAVTGYISHIQEFNIAFLPLMVMALIRELSGIYVERHKQIKQHDR